jgi:hypothetical protein
MSPDFIAIKIFGDVKLSGHGNPLDHHLYVSGRLNLFLKKICKIGIMTCAIQFVHAIWAPVFRRMSQMIQAEVDQADFCKRVQSPPCMDAETVIPSGSIDNAGDFLCLVRSYSCRLAHMDQGRTVLGEESRIEVACFKPSKIDVRSPLVIWESLPCSSMDKAQKIRYYCRGGWW